MKKKFEIPAVDIHMFQLENVITASGDSPSKTASEKAQEAFGSSVNGFINLEVSTD